LDNMRKSYLLGAVFGMLLLLQGSAVAQPPPGATDQVIVDPTFDTATGVNWNDTSTSGNATSGTGFGILNTAAGSLAGGTFAELTQAVTVNGSGLARIFFDLLSVQNPGVFNVLFDNVIVYTQPGSTGPAAGLQSAIFNVAAPGVYNVEIQAASQFGGNFVVDNFTLLAQPAPPPVVGGGGVPEISASSAGLPIAIVLCLGLLLSSGERKRSTVVAG
jgi:hypothetical protein